jgi:hypothetical protein
MAFSSNCLLLLVLPPFLISVHVSLERVLYAKAGVVNALDFVSLDPSDYGIIAFAGVEPSGPENQSLTLIQVKSTPSSLGSIKSHLLAFPAGWI